MKRHRPQPVASGRRGTLMPLLGLAILAICAAGALVLDRMWIDAAQVQLHAAAEAAALAAAGQLADDDRLRTPYDASGSIEEALAAADFIARGNYVAGHPVELDLEPEGDVRFGRIVENPTTGLPLFLETDIDPTSVFVVTQSLRERGNPLRMFFPGVTGEPAADAQGHAEATIDNRIIGIRPLPDATVPALPIGILETDPNGSWQNTWEQQIDLARGQDLFGYDEIGDALIEQPDGIPEIILTIHAGDDQTLSQTADAAATALEATNVQILDLGNDLLKGRVQEQIARGIGAYGMEVFGGALLLDFGPVRVEASHDLVVECLDDLQQQIGRTRICLLYRDDESGGGRTQITRLVAVRLLKIRQSADGPLEIVAQPAVIATRAAVLSEDPHAVTNPYIYKLHLTH